MGSRERWIIFSVVCIIVGVLIINTARHDNEPRQIEPKVFTPEKKDVVKESDSPELTATLMSSAMGSYNFQQWISAEEANRQAELQRQKAEADEAARIAQIQEDAYQAAARAAVSHPAPVMTSQGCCGPHSDQWWMGVAQCEQSGRNDAYFGYFSFMDGSQGGKPWADQVAAGNALLARAGRESPTWAQSCVDAGYRNSPGG